MTDLARGERETAPSGVRTSPSVVGRARLHRGCAIAGLFLSAAWSASLSGSAGVDLAVAKRTSIANVVGLSGLLLLALAMSRAPRFARIFDRACTVVAIAVLVAWVRAAGTSSSPLIAFVPLLVMAHRATGGPAAGWLAWGTASLLQGAAIGLEAAGLLEYAPLYSNRPLVTDAWYVVLAGMLAANGAALVLGRIAGKGERDQRSLATAAPTPTAGRHVGMLLAGKYRLLSVIGRGGMGEVYTAEQLSTGARVAVKVLHLRTAENPTALERFRREVAGASRLPAGRIARVLDSGQSTEGLCFIVMERLVGEDLGARLDRDGRLDLSEALGVVEQLAETLDAAARNGIVHRDVKPRNVFLVKSAETPDARLLDFGICRFQEGASGMSVTTTAALLGTPGFLAPEQVAESAGAIGPHTDVFALAAVAYRALSGVKAFPGKNATDAVFEALNHDPAPLSTVAKHLPPALDSVLVLGLAKAPAERYATAGEFARDLRAAASGVLSAAVRDRAARLVAARVHLHDTATTAA